jgi:hypothetical protein
MSSGEDECISRDSSGSGTSISGSGSFWPFTEQASTGIRICFLDCMGSLGHIRFALRSIGAEQLYLMVKPAIVSPGRTL